MSPTISQNSPQAQALEQAIQSGRIPAALSAFQEWVLSFPSPADAGQAATSICRRLMDDFYILEVVTFAKAASNPPPTPATSAAAILLAELDPELQAINKWRRTLRDIATERQARDLRAQVRSRDIAGAVKSTAAILSQTITQEHRQRVCRQIGAILGSLPHDGQRALEVVDALPKALKSGTFSAEDFAVLRATFAETQKGMTASAITQSELQWNRIHTEAVIELMRALPGRVTVAEATEEMELRFYAALHAAAAAYFLEPQSLEFRDIVRIFQEFCPADTREVGPVEGIEDTAFQKMLPPDRLISVRALRRLGEKDRLLQVIQNEAQNAKDNKTIEYLVRLLGGLGSAAALPFLQQILREKLPERLEAATVDAIGRLGGESATRVLLGILSETSKERVIDPPIQRKLTTVLAGLGRIARSPKTTAQQRNAIVSFTFRALPDNRPLGRAALLNLCTYHAAGLAEETRRQIMAPLVDGLWTLDMRSKLAKGDPNQKSELGFRADLVNILVQLGHPSLPLLLEAAKRRVSQYNGAYWAIGEALSKIGDPTALPLLREMAVNTLRVDESAIPEHLRETYFDVSKDQYVPISRDKILQSLFFAIQKKCGPAGEAFLMEAAKRVRAREYTMPGPETESFLGALILSHGGSASSLQAPASSNEEPSMGPIAQKIILENNPFEDNAFAPKPHAASPTPNQPAPAATRPRKDEPLKNLLKDILGKGLFGVKIEKRVSAIQEVGARGETEAIPALCELLDNTETILRRGAETALAEIVNPKASQQAYGVGVYEMLACMAKAPVPRVKAIQHFFKRQNPHTPPLQPHLRRFIDTEGNQILVKFAREILDAPPPAANALQQGGDKGPNAQQILALKRKYFTDRKAWIDGGKKGPEPQPPPEI